MSIVALCVLAPLVIVGTCIRKSVTCPRADIKATSQSDNRQWWKKQFSVQPYGRSQVEIISKSKDLEHFKQNYPDGQLSQKVVTYLTKLQETFGFGEELLGRAGELAAMLKSMTILDFDDTIFPTRGWQENWGAADQRSFGDSYKTWARSKHGLDEETEEDDNVTDEDSHGGEDLAVTSFVEVEGRKDYRLHLQTQVVNLLTKAQKRGIVAIVTNGGIGWVEFMCRQYYPAVYKMLPNILVLSTRAVVDTKNVHSSNWKVVAYPLLQRELMKQIREMRERILKIKPHEIIDEIGKKLPFLKINEHQSVEKVLAVGDAEHDMFAAKCMQKLWVNVQLTCVKLKDRPKISDLHNEIARVLEHEEIFSSAGRWDAIVGANATVPAEGFNGTNGVEFVKEPDVDSLQQQLTRLETEQVFLFEEQLFEEAQALGPSIQKLKDAWRRIEVDFTECERREKAVIVQE